MNTISGNDSTLDLATVAGPFHASLSAYAAQDPPCFNQVPAANHDTLSGHVTRSSALIGQVFSSPSVLTTAFMKYGPVILMLEAMTLITMERISIFFPRMRQKIERFYHSVVEVDNVLDICQFFAKCFMQNC